MPLALVVCPGVVSGGGLGHALHAAGGTQSRGAGVRRGCVQRLSRLRVPWRERRGEDKFAAGFMPPAEGRAGAS